MNASSSSRVNWKWSVFPALAILFLSLVPQLHFWIVRGSQWHGAYAILQGDETYYSAYINALIDGRPRRNDPFTGQDDHPLAPMYESLFSVQFIPPYVIALFARASGLSASSAFIVLAAATGLFASLAIFWLLASVTGDSKFAVLGVLVVLCLGAVAGGQGWIGLIVKSDAMFAGQLYLRRYLPSSAFPLFFVFCGLVSQALTITGKRAATVRAMLAGLTLAVLIFSYFYLWTAAVAWLVCIALLWLIFRPDDRRRTIWLLMIAALPITLALALYEYLLSHLAPALDRAWVQTVTHRPDLLRVPEMLGVLILATLIMGVRRGRISLSEPRVIFAASFALLPFLVFNQQVITGRSIQPYHYEIFIANYVILVALVIVIKLLRRPLSRQALITAASVCFLWGAIEVNQQFKIRSTFDVANDEMVPVLLRLKELATSDGTWDGLRNHGRAQTLVFSPQYGVSRLLPTWAPQGSLLASGSAAFQSLSPTQRKEWLFMHLYYSGKKTEELVELLSNQTDDLPFANFTRGTLFGNERALLFLGSNSRTIRQDEIEQEARAYETFTNSFSRAQAQKRPLAYVIANANDSFDFSRVDLWYERDSGERIGVYTLYRVKLREPDMNAPDNRSVSANIGDR
jgi:hypothetical protein